MSEKTKVIQWRLTEQEKAQIQQEAKKMHLSVSGYLRVKVFNNK